MKLTITSFYFLILVNGVLIFNSKVKAQANPKPGQTPPPVVFSILSPLENSIVPAENIFVSIALKGNNNFIPSSVLFFLDNQPIQVNPKFNQNKLSFIYVNHLSNGLHQITIKGRVKGGTFLEVLSWKFYVNVKSDDQKNLNNKTLANPKKLVLTGNILADNRTQFLSGDGKNLRQEPSYTRTVSVNLAAKFRNTVIPIKYFGTSDNYNYSGVQLQNRNFFQIGLQNKWLDFMYGDLNPNMDRLLLNGIRVHGFRAALKWRANSLQFYKGDINNAIEGNLVKYEPGNGTIPPTFYNDSMYINSGTYRRTMLAARLEFANRKDYYKIGFDVFKAKDDINSIKYGVAPKDNVSAGFDMTYKLFKRNLVFNFGGAISAITNDISGGAISKQQVDTLYDTKLPIDPLDFKNILIINSTTVPILPVLSNFSAYFGSVALNTKYQNFFLEYRRNGPQFTSLGNPFLRNNYEGYLASERIALWKRKITLNMNYQKFSNDLSKSLISKINTEVVNGSILLNLNAKLPYLMVNCMQQARKAEKFITEYSNINDQITLITVTLNYSKTQKRLGHNFRIMYNSNSREDFIRPESANKFQNMVVGFTEYIVKRYSINLEYGKTLITDRLDNAISDMDLYNFSFDWQIKPNKVFFGLSASNNINQASLYMNQSQRLSLIGRFGFKFFKGMGLDFEYGYQPYRDMAYSINNYDDQYAYVRYTYEINTSK